jgi:hypothetical protein
MTKLWSAAVVTVLALTVAAPVAAEPPACEAADEWPRAVARTVRWVGDLLALPAVAVVVAWAGEDDGGDSAGWSADGGEADGLGAGTTGDSQAFPEIDPNG